VLSKKPGEEYTQVDGFLQDKKGKTGQNVNISIGKIGLNYFCRNCDDLRTFYYKDKLSIIFVNKNLISIDCVVTCGCGNAIPVWFLIESKDDITGQAPYVKIIKKSDKLINTTKADVHRYGEFTKLLDKAEQAYNEELAAGAVVYLRKIFEKITIESANAMDIEYKKHKNGNPKNFSDLLEKVDEKCSIIPKEFSENSYKLFKELSEVIHGEYDENMGLSNFDALYRLVIGILENIKNHKELLQAMEKLSWETNKEE